MRSRDLSKCMVMSGSSRCSIHSCVLLLPGQLKEGKQARSQKWDRLTVPFLGPLATVLSNSFHWNFPVPKTGPPDGPVFGTAFFLDLFVDFGRPVHSSNG